MLKYMLLLIIITTILWGCAGENKTEADTSPPQKPVMIPHLGDTGIPDSTINFYTDSNNYELENNGIDAVPDGNWIQIQWTQLTDNDIKAIEIYRFSEEDYLTNSSNFVTKIDSFNYKYQNFYIDKFNNTTNSVNKNWFYFIQVIDQYGNTAKSDTIGYRLIEKPLLISPANNIEISNTSEITFEWQLPAATTASQSHLLIFDENYQLIWRYSPLDMENTSIKYTIPSYFSNIYWRVDIIGQTIENIIIEEQNHIVESGSEAAIQHISIK